ncbi:hypothetical protein PIB30_084624 [Stylosanthes scabra]|uniref:Uncharacterized protein n=1 Tax=Stylosanthes scabra TaxID=79078 RepID=A0ABU6WQY3_9FABA|nr:hypothetical protein [Stylosanthes scabra]
MEIVHSASSEATPSKLPSELHFEWVNPLDMNFLGPQHYGLLDTDGQLKALCGVLDKKVKVGALSSRKHLGPWQPQEKLVDSSNNGRTNHVWDPGKSYKNQHFWGLVTYLGILASLMYMIWDPIKLINFKHRWGFVTSVRVLRSLVHETWDIEDQCNDKNWWKFQEFKHKPP